MSDARDPGRDGWVPWLRCTLCGRYFPDPSPARESDETAIWCECVNGPSVGRRERFRRGHDPRGVSE